MALAVTSCNQLILSRLRVSVLWRKHKQNVKRMEGGDKKRHLWTFLCTTDFSKYVPLMAFVYTVPEVAWLPFERKSTDKCATAASCVPSVQHKGGRPLQYPTWLPHQWFMLDKPKGANCTYIIKSKAHGATRALSSLCSPFMHMICKVQCQPGNRVHCQC